MFRTQPPLTSHVDEFAECNLISFSLACPLNRVRATKRSKPRKRKRERERERGRKKEKNEIRKHYKRNSGIGTKREARPFQKLFLRGKNNLDVYTSRRKSTCTKLRPQKTKTDVPFNTFEADDAATRRVIL